MERFWGVLGGSGVYALSDLDDVEIRAVDTPWGPPSGEITIGRLNGVEIAFLPRHGDGHRIPPSDINYRANIDALKRIGVTDIISVSACGSFREDLPPGMFVLVDQFIDRTHARAKSFFGQGCVAHVSMADPVCHDLLDMLGQSCKSLGLAFRRGGVYLAMEGPQFSSRAESLLYKSWGCDVIGMTNMPEAKLAREAELPYATIAMVTDYDCWHEGAADVEVTNVLEILKSNAKNARHLIKHLTQTMGPHRQPSRQGIEHGLDFAIVTPPEARDPALLAKLDAVAGRLLQNRD